MKSEKTIQNEIRLALSKYGVVFRANVGKIRMKDGRWFDTGLPPGFSDLFGFRFKDGRIFFIEVKNKIGKTSEVQNKFLNAMTDHGAITGVARSKEEAISIVMEE